MEIYLTVSCGDQTGEGCVEKQPDSIEAFWGHGRAHIPVVWKELSFHVPASPQHRKSILTKLKLQQISPYWQLKLCKNSVCQFCQPDNIWDQLYKVLLWVKRNITTWATVGFVSLSNWCTFTGLISFMPNCNFLNL